MNNLPYCSLHYPATISNHGSGEKSMFVEKSMTSTSMIVERQREADLLVTTERRLYSEDYEVLVVYPS